MGYTRRQLVLLLLLVLVAGLGVAVGHWRRAHPDLADALERFDHSPPPSRPAGLGDARPSDGVAPPAPGRDAEPADAASSGRGPSPAPDATPRRPRPIDLNRAGADELTRLPGVGPVLAARIVSRREAAGPFASVDDLAGVPGVGPGRLERLRPLVTVAP